MLTALLLSSCGSANQEGSHVEALALFTFNGWNETRAYQLDSVGQVHTLRLNVETQDSVVSCFTLTPSQLRQVMAVAQEIAQVPPHKEAREQPISCSDCGMTKAVLYRHGKSRVYQGDWRQFEPSLKELVRTLLKADSLQPQHPCTSRFQAPELTQGVEDLFRLTSLE
ncbi:hypothetical protein [Hymenobacter cavernae]|uniref:hypothetical protein n=1 Tax=Hymenobacter cavernae TaxID=2044852 RepID=UPI0016662E7C|nr:hypothetical protein [Hymenobacter cavernae]